MTLLEYYVMFGLPAIALLMAWGAHKLVDADYRRLDERARTTAKSR